MDDAELLRSYARNQSETAFSELVRRHINLVYSCALRQVNGDRHRAEEIAQAVFIDLARKADSVAKHPTLAGWLYTSTHYAASKLKRTERRRQFHEKQIMSAAIEMHEPDWEQVGPMLDEAMHELGHTERDMIVLRYMEQKSMTEVGAQLGLSESGARKRMERALERLRIQLARRGVTSTPAALSLALTSRTVLAAPPGLAAAVGAGVIAAGNVQAPLFFGLMSATKLQVGIIALAMASVAGLWFSQQHQLSRIQSDLADEKTRLEAFQVKIVEANRGATAARKALDESAGINLAGGGALGSLPVTPGFTVASSRAQLDQDYAGLFRGLRLDRETLERLRDLLAERKVRAWNANRYVVELNGQSLDEWVNKTEETEYVATATRDIDERIQALLGDEKYARVQSYVSTLPWRTPFKDLAALLLPVDPLSEEQIDQLTSWAAASSPDLFINVVKSGPKIPDDVITRARSFLSPVQLERLIEVKASTDAYKKMQTFNQQVKESEETAVRQGPQ